jgi:hypothetical protein
MLGRTIRCAIAVALAAGAFGAPAASAQTAGPGGPVLVVTDPGDGFGGYYSEILRAEGLNEFATASVGALSPALLSSYQVVVLAETSVTPAQASALQGWVNAGGNLIAMRPGDELASLLGLGPDGGDVSNGYLAVNTTSAPGAGITAATMQYHGTADRRGALPGTATVAALYDNASSPSGAPAVTLRSVGAAGGQAAAFTYDLAKSVVYTRQGNPAWAGQERDGITPKRSDDLFFGGSSQDWVNLDKVAIPQADEQQRLLANLIIQMNLDLAPLPRFWYLPRGAQAAVVMTGDDHGNGGTAGQFNRFKAASPAGCSVPDWGCVRSTSYVYPNTPVSDPTGYQADGFEIALHLNTGCSDFTPTSINSDWTQQLAQFRTAFPGIANPRTNRTHCIAWSDWVGEATAANAHGVRLDTNYYYWPGSWIQDRPGMFTGSGFPQRFADLDGSLVDVYQAATQLTDESDQTLSTHIRALIDGALGSAGYYGVFTANMHTDSSSHAGADTIVAEAVQRGVPVVSAAQMLDWIDGRNASAFRNISYGSQRLRFTVEGGNGSRGLQAMLPLRTAGGQLSSLTRDGAAVSAPVRVVKGMEYAFFPAANGNYVATYGNPVPDTVITGASVSGGTARLSFVSDTPGSTFQCRLDGGAWTACASPRVYNGLSKGTHTFHVRAIDPSGTMDATPAERRFTVGTAVLPGGSGGNSGPGEGGPRVRIRPKRVQVTEDGIVRLRVRCPTGQRRCKVRLRLKVGKKIVASRTFLVKSGKRRAIDLRLRRSTRASLARKKTLRVTAVAVSKNPLGDRAVTRKTIRLVAR